MAAVAATAVTSVRAGRIGPNAITRVAEVLPVLLGASGTRRLFDSAGLGDYLRQPPEHMVDEAEVARLHQVLRAELGPALAGEVARSAGLRTADYLLARRIPQPVQWLLKRLPPLWAARVLLQAIGRHAWTFAGSGVFRAQAGRPCVLTIADNPLCRGVHSPVPACDFYSAVFERLFQVLVHPGVRVVETACEARGDPVCRFELRW
jgi:divinyl protochlorophyllide a 8-vinyl-reductase